MRRIITLAVAAFLVSRCIGTPAFPQEAPTGPARVRLAQENIVLELGFEGGAKMVVTSKPTPLQAGTYWVKSMRLLKKDDKGRVWEMRQTGGLGAIASVTVDAGQDKVIDVGEPIHLRIAAGQPKDKPDILVFNLSVLGKYGEGYYPGAWLDGKRPPPPSFRVLNEAGKTVLTAQFAPADSNQMSFQCKVPKGLTGKFKIETSLVTGPFEWNKFERDVELK